MNALISPACAAAVLQAHANYEEVSALELQQALEYAAALCRLAPAVQELSEAAQAFAGFCGAPMCPGPLEHRLLDAIDRVKEQMP